MSGHVLAVASGKGGVGKTTTAINLGVGFRLHDESVVLVDADLGMPNLARMLGVSHSPTLHDVLADEAGLENALVEVANNFFIVPGDPDLEGFASADPNRLGDIVDSLAERFDHVVVDTSAGLSYESVLPLEVAEEILLVTLADPPSLDDTEKTLALSDRLGTPIRGVVITRATDETDAETVAIRLGLEVLALIPDEPAVAESGSTGRPLEAHAPDSGAAEAYRQLATDLLEAAADEADSASTVPDAKADRTPDGGTPVEEVPSDGAGAPGDETGADPEPAAGPLGAATDADPEPADDDGPAEESGSRSGDPEGEDDGGFEPPSAADADPDGPGEAEIIEPASAASKDPEPSGFFGRFSRLFR